MATPARRGRANSLGGRNGTVTHAYTARTPVTTDASLTESIDDTPPAAVPLAKANNHVDGAADLKVGETGILELLWQAKSDIFSCSGNLGVPISQACAVTGLAEPRLRYFVENLEILQSPESPVGLRPDGALHTGAHNGVYNTTERHSSRRLYTLQDLRRLRAIALLLDQDVKPRHAAALLKRYATHLENDITGGLSSLLRREGDAITDGFLLSRLSSQLMYAVQVELASQMGYDPAIVGMIYLPSAGPLDATLTLAASADTALSASAVHELGSRMTASPIDLLIALDRARIDAPGSVRTPDIAAGQDDSLILFYSRDHWEFPLDGELQYCMYTSTTDPSHRMLILIEASKTTIASAPLPAHLHVKTRGRAELMDRLLALCADIYPEFREATRTKNYRYRSDGSPIAYTQELYTRVLGVIRTLIFPGVQESMACLLVPNSLAYPEWLSVLAYSNYDTDLAERVKLQLRDIGQGISGRAYNTRQAIFSLHAEDDRRLAYGMEEQAKVALAIPLSERWTSGPFGVLYLASQRPGAPDTSTRALAGLLLGNIVSELVGRWWLTRLRRAHDKYLHEQTVHMIHWLEGMDQHGPDFERALDCFEQLRRDAASLDTMLSDTTSSDGTDRSRPAERQLALIVFDIDPPHHPPQHRLEYVESNEPLMLRAQLHVAEAIQDTVKDLSLGVRGPWWFKNDHSLLILDGQPDDEALRCVRRIMERIGVLPLRLSDQSHHRAHITVSAAVKMMTYQTLHDLAGYDPVAGSPTLRRHMREIVDDIYLQTRERKRPQTIWTFDLAAGAWREV